MKGARVVFGSVCVCVCCVFNWIFDLICVIYVDEDGDNVTQ